MYDYDVHNIIARDVKKLFDEVMNCVFSIKECGLLEIDSNK